MAGSRPTGTWTRVQMFFNADMKQYSNEFYYTQTAAVTIPQMEAEANAIVTFLSNAMTAVMSSAWTCRGGYVEFSDGTTVVGWDSYQPAVGLIDEDPLPEDVAVVVQRYTATPNRSGRGRLFIAGCPVTFDDGSYLSTVTGQAGINALITQFGLAITGPVSSYTPAFFSKKNGGPVVPIVAWDFSAQLATKRRRRGKF